MRDPNKNPLLSSILAAGLVAILFCSACFSVQAQSVASFTTADPFAIPEKNSAIHFAVNGTYTQASLENGTWFFTDLHLNNAGPAGTLESFQASVQDCNVMILMCQRLNFSNTVVRLRYNVTGAGVQAFKFGLNLTGGDWMVTLNNDFKAENDGWSVLPDGTLTVTGATANVSISYYVFPHDFGGPDTSDQSFFQQHSVSITIGVSVAVAVVLAVGIRVRSGTNEQTKADRQQETRSQGVCR
ncbi:MAG: hypothetical protein NWF05_04740 [Candidatus Bathyarchaeota archaeon]|nr:hypothetical protein [Candidatus Bathyarchaeota archaeon]